jgi:RNA-directed DNA polymerase
LRRRGVDPALAAKTAGSPKGPRRLANSQALKTALPNAFFRSLGIATLEPRRVA